jgi:hypothetical protein
LIFANAVEEFDAGDGDFCSSEPLEVEHRTNPGFYRTVILFNDIVQRYCSGVLTIEAWYCSKSHSLRAILGRLHEMRHSHQAHNRRVRQGQATFGHHLYQIPEAQLEAKIPPHT